MLANEQVIDGRGWRSGAIVEKRKLSQWVLKITAYADDLLAALKTLDRWPEKVRLMQENWIGKSTGLMSASARLRKNQETSRPSSRRAPTLYMARRSWRCRPTIRFRAEVAKNPAPPPSSPSAKRQGTSEAVIEAQEKRGFAGSRAIHPFTGKKLPVYIANFVLMEYGTGAIFGSPATTSATSTSSANTGSGSFRWCAAGRDAGDLQGHDDAYTATA